MHQPAPPSPRTALKRRPLRADYAPETLRAILDEAFVCHVGFVHEGVARVIPTAFARAGDHVYLHGSPANRMLQSLCRGEACITVTLLDGLVLARSAFHQSVNYRSVMIFGRGEELVDRDAKCEAMRCLIEHVMPGRWRDVREPSEKELAGTRVVRVPIGEASAKLRGGPPVDEPEDYALPVWAGHVPLRMAAGAPVDDPRNLAGLAAPDYARRYRRGAGARRAGTP